MCGLTCLGVSTWRAGDDLGWGNWLLQERTNNIRIEEHKSRFVREANPAERSLNTESESWFIQFMVIKNIVAWHTSVPRSERVFLIWFKKIFSPHLGLVCSTYVRDLYWTSRDSSHYRRASESSMCGHAEFSMFLEGAGVQIKVSGY